MADQEIQNAVINHARADMANIPAASHDAPEAKGHKIGEGHFMGMVRLGGHELTQALAAFPESNIRPQEEMGVFGNTTPQIVSEQMGYEPMYEPSTAVIKHDHDHGIGH